MTLNTYLTFEDNCREAFDFYRSVFGGEFDAMETFRGGPPTWACRRRSWTGSCTSLSR